MALSRSEQMSRIRGTKTQPEVLLRRALKKGQPGRRIGRIRPDLVLLRPKRVAIFVDGCFWHGCPDHYVRPRTGTAFWARKLRENTERDARQTAQLRADGWLVIRFWEHEVRQNPAGAARRAALAIESGRSRLERWRVIHVVPLRGELEERELRKLLRPHLWRSERGPRTTAKLGRVVRTVVAEGES